MKLLKSISIGILVTIGVTSAYGFFDNNLKAHRKETEIVDADILNITRRYSSSTKTKKYRLYLKTEGKEIVISHPKYFIRELYRNRDKYIGQTIEIEKTKYYNKKNKLNSTLYNIPQEDN
jgi:hypothetical protein